MTKKFFKKKSKRLPAGKRYKIEKKVKEHRRKLRKEAKKRANKPSKKLHFKVPNSCPFKNEILQEAGTRRQEEERKKELRKKELREIQKSKRQNEIASRRTLESLTQDADCRAQEYEKNEKEQSPLNLKASSQLNDKSAKRFYQEFQKVVDEADIILEVLDARDPLGSRSSVLEKTILETSGCKKLILVLNKADLVPKHILEKWLKYLRLEFPTVIFKSCTASTHQKITHAGAKDVLQSSEGLLSSSRCLGAEALMNLLSNYCRTHNLKTFVSVGVVGYPNVGKSSLINSLKRERVCKISSNPGATSCMQTVHLDKHIRLLDCPGLILDNNTSGLSCAVAALKNAFRIEQIEDPVLPVEAILQRANKNQLLAHYRLSNYSNTQEFLQLLACRLGKLKKGGIPDITAAARHLLNEWTCGKIKYYTEPPESTESVHLESQLVRHMSAEFDLNQIQTLEVHDFQQLSSSHVENGGHVNIPKKLSVADCSIPQDTLKPVPSTKHQSAVQNPARQLKMRFKRLKQQRARQGRLAKKLAENMCKSLVLDSNS